MLFEELMAADTPEKIKNLQELCYRAVQLMSEYKQGMKPPPKEISQKLQITVEEYSELSQFILNGGFEDLTKQIIREDFQNGATFI